MMIEIDRGWIKLGGFQLSWQRRPAEEPPLPWIWYPSDDCGPGFQFRRLVVYWTTLSQARELDARWEDRRRAGEAQRNEWEANRARCEQEQAEAEARWAAEFGMPPEAVTS